MKCLVLFGRNSIAINSRCFCLVVGFNREEPRFVKKKTSFTNFLTSVKHSGHSLLMIPPNSNSLGIPFCNFLISLAESWKGGTSVVFSLLRQHVPYRWKLNNRSIKKPVANVSLCVKTYPINFQYIYIYYYSIIITILLLEYYILERAVAQTYWHQNSWWLNDWHTIKMKDISVAPNCDRQEMARSNHIPVWIQRFKSWPHIL